MIKFCIVKLALPHLSSTSNLSWKGCLCRCIRTRMPVGLTKDKLIIAITTVLSISRSLRWSHWSWNQRERQQPAARHFSCSSGAGRHEWQRKRCSVGSIIIFTCLLVPALPLQATCRPLQSTFEKVPIAHFTGRFGCISCVFHPF